MATETVYDVLMRAQRLAATRSHSSVVASHLTLALLDCDAEDRVQQLLDARAIKRDELRIYLEAVTEATAQPTAQPTARPMKQPEAQSDREPRPVPNLGALLREASRQAHDYDEAENQNALLLIALAAEHSANGKTLRALGLQPAELRLKLRRLTRAAAPNGHPLKMLDAEAQSALEAAHDIMRAAGCGRISTAHLLLGVLANREVYALQSLADNGVNLDELARLARQNISSDGELATAQIRLNKGAKRALERARDVVPRRTARQKIALPALLWSLLPRPLTLRERLKWGEVDDPLARVWSGFDAALIERVSSVLLGLPVADLPAAPLYVPNTRAYIDWRGLMAGAVFALICGTIYFQIKQTETIFWFSAVFCAALCADWWGRANGSSPVRSAALSFLVGCIAMLVASAFWLMNYGS